ncbi:hypothetical protein BBW65_03760 [Helicobacter enhydrae]|uniref:Sialidase domain-containing protein n=2 Tax=Helicobacter enhydrae TaxID=222136 RepID=A0A1B1U7N0_9HELI|nr:hypothetical protein BBW65_03760 [Helicobacter enhydrae]
MTQATEIPIFLKNNLASISHAPSAHSATIASLDNNRLLAMWFAGTGEGKSDVEIYGSVYDPQNNAWSEPKSYLNRNRLSLDSHQYIKKLGNPVLYKSQNGTIHLFVTAVSLGGWATSKIYHYISQDNAQSFSYKQELQLGALMNLSFLVRTQPVGLQDGGFYLPIYHELAKKYALIAHFDPSGNMLEVRRINPENGLLQPSITAINQKECLAVFRNYESGPMKVQKCSNGGMLWGELLDSNVLNEGNTANVVNFDGEILLIHNTREGVPSESRGTLILSKLQDLKSLNEWQQLEILDVAQGVRSGDQSVEVSYPTTIVNGDFVDIVYTNNRTHISHIRFNKKWLMQRGK